MAPDLRTVIDVSRDEVIAPGSLGAFDEHGIFPFHVVRMGERVAAYTTGWSRRVAVPVETAIGLAFSDDGGRRFERFGTGPVLAASLHEPFLVGDGFVKAVSDVFHMWYIFGTEWRCFVPDGVPERIYKIGHATSTDGITWRKEEGCAIVADRLGPDESQALPTVVDLWDRHHMFFCYRQSFDFRRNPERGYRIGHAWSDDLRTWTRDDASLALDLTPGEWDSEMLCYPHAFRAHGNVWLLYNGNEFGRFGFGAAILE
jgi:sucrose-6-phosphate hydrolase SacC (GH32 family)